MRPGITKTSEMAGQCLYGIGCVYRICHVSCRYGFTRGVHDSADVYRTAFFRSVSKSALAAVNAVVSCYVFHCPVWCVLDASGVGAYTQRAIKAGWGKGICRQNAGCHVVCGFSGIVVVVYGPPVSRNV